MILKKINKQNLSEYKRIIKEKYLEDIEYNFHFYKQTKLLFLIAKNNDNFRTFFNINYEDSQDINKFSDTNSDFVSKKLDSFLLETIIDYPEYFVKDKKFGIYARVFYKLNNILNKIEDHDDFYIVYDKDTPINLLKINNEYSNDFNHSNVQSVLVDNFTDYNKSILNHSYMVKDLINEILKSIKIHKELNKEKTINSLINNQNNITNEYLFAAKKMLLDHSFFKNRVTPKSKYINKKTFLFHFQNFLLSNFISFVDYKKSYDLSFNAIGFNHTFLLFNVLDYYKNIYLGKITALSPENHFKRDYSISLEDACNILNFKLKKEKKYFNLFQYFKQKKIPLELKNKIKSFSNILNLVFYGTELKSNSHLKINDFVPFLNSVLDDYNLINDIIDFYIKSLNEIYHKKEPNMNNIEYINRFSTFSFFILYNKKIKNKKTFYTIAINEYKNSNYDLTLIEKLLNSPFYLKYDFDFYSLDEIEYFYMSYILKQIKEKSFKLQNVIKRLRINLMHIDLYDSYKKESIFVLKLLKNIEYMKHLGISEKNILQFLLKIFHVDEQTSNNVEYISHNIYFEFENTIFPLISKMKNSHKKMNNSIFKIMLSYQSNNFYKAIQFLNYLNENIKYIYASADQSFKNSNDINFLISSEIEKELQKQIDTISQYISIDKNVLNAAKNMFALQPLVNSILTSIKDNYTDFKDESIENEYFEFNEHFNVYILNYKNPLGMLGSSVNGVCISQDGLHRISQYNKNFFNLVVLDKKKNTIILWGLLCKAEKNNEKIFVLNNLQGGINNKHIEPRLVLSSIMNSLNNWSLENNITNILINNAFFNKLSLETPFKYRLNDVDYILNEHIRLDFEYNTVLHAIKPFPIIDNEEK